MASSTFRLSPLNIFLSGALVVTLFVLMIDVQRPQSEETKGDRHYQGCTGEVRQDVQLSQEQLAQVLAVPERDAKATIREILAEPYCTLPPIEIRSGVQSEREAYPLAFNPDAWLVILYEGDEYAGHRISIKS
ncbi:MAG: hypothetical protein WBA57_10400 [Elainellaceae cyanobacterium]